MKIYSNNLYKINYPESLARLTEETAKLLNSKVLIYKDLFKIDNVDQVIVNYFDNLTEFREFIYGLRGERDSLPDYAVGTYDNGMINAYINPNNQIKRLYTASHELFHILYMKYILKNDYSKRIVWYDEGMAQFMSGEKQIYNDEEKFKEFYLKVKEGTKSIPEMNLIEHGNLFCNEKYNGYDLSYLAIKYLSEVLSSKDFQNLMSDFDKIKKIGNDIVIKMFEHYDNKYTVQ